MSLALRSNASRRDKRNTSALPYSRPTKQAKRAPLFSLDGIVNWFKSFAGNEEPEEEVEETSNIAPPNPAAAALRERADDREEEATTARAQIPPPPPPRRPQQSSSMLSLPGTYVPTPLPSTASVPQVQQQTQPTPSIPPPPPRAASRKSTSPLLDQGGSPAENLATVSAFLAGKNGQPLNRVEVAGLVSLIQNSMPDDEPYEPFRFSTSPTTPRDNTPPGGMNGDTSNKEQPRKTLAKNPNGTYRWQGAGSARPRNRYQSPAFGPSRAQPVRLKISPEQPTTDSKRRRVGESATASSSQRAPAPTSSARPAATTTNATASGSGINGTSKAQSSSSFLKVPQASTSSTSKTTSAAPAAPPTTPSRIRTNVKTAPAVPSPLRQAWGQTDSPSPPANKPTRAANMMTELIKDATPPKKAFANPYQAALPGPMINKPKKPTGRKRAAAAKAEAAAKAAAEAEAKAKAAEEEARKQREAEMMSPQKIIEATVPKGAKRSRPPPDLEKPKPDAPPSPTSRRSTRLKSPSPQSAFGSTQSKASVSPYKVTIEEVSDEDEPSPSKKAKTNGPSLAPIPAPRFTQPPVTVEVMGDTEMATEDSTPVVQPSQIIEPEDNTRRSASPTAASPAVPANPFNKTFGMKSSAPKAPSKLRYSIRPEDQSREQEGSLEVEKTEKSFGLHTPTPSLQSVAGEAQPGTSATVKSSATPQQSSFQTESEVKEWVKTLPPAQLPTYNFTIPMSSPGAGPSTFKAREAAKAESPSSLPKYDFTSSSASTAAAKAPEVKSFDWAAAGMKPPSQPTDGSWKCSECTLITKDPAANKCAACDAPRAGAAPKPATQGFNWAAAGMKPPSQPADGSWKCGICGCVTPASGEKCVSCQEPRPGAKPAAPVQGFNWAAAGLKQPDLSGIWICSLCSGKSPQSESECVICKEPR